MYAMNMNMKFKKEEKRGYQLRTPFTPVQYQFSSLSLLQHEPTHNYHVVVFLGSNPGFCQPDWGSIVGLHDPIRFAYIDLLGSCGSTGVGSVGVVVGSCQQKDEDFRFSLGCGGGGV